MTSALRPCLLVLSCASVALLPVPALSQTALPLTKPETGKATDAAPAVYQFVAKTAGVLTVAVEGSGDLALAVTDADGQPLPNGTSDRDLNGAEGTEQLSVTISEAGAYQVRVRVNGGGASAFQIGASWLSFPSFARDPDPDGRATKGQPLQVGQAHEDSLAPAKGDNWDWFIMKTTQAGTLAIVTRAQGDEKPDLVLEVYTGGDFAKPSSRSDRDLQANSANESVTVNVTAGETVHVKVSGAFSSTAAKYRLSSTLIP